MLSPATVVLRAQRAGPCLHAAPACPFVFSVFKKGVSHAPFGTGPCTDGCCSRSPPCLPLRLPSGREGGGGGGGGGGLPPALEEDEVRCPLVQTAAAAAPTAAAVPAAAAAAAAHAAPPVRAAPRTKHLARPSAPAAAAGARAAAGAHRAAVRRRPAPADAAPPRQPGASKRGGRLPGLQVQSVCISLPFCTKGGRRV